MKKLTWILALTLCLALLLTACGEKPAPTPDPVSYTHLTLPTTERV